MMPYMRTTLTIDDRLAAALRKKAFEEDKTFKAVVNEVLQKGLEYPPQKPAKERFKQKTHHMGKELIELTHVNRILGEWEDEELIRKMELRK